MRCPAFVIGGYFRNGESMGKMIVGGIDFISTWIGKMVAWVVILNILALVYEFFARYVFGSPTIWAYEATYFLYGTHFLLGSGYTLFMKSHVRIDIFYQRLSPRTQASFDTVGYLIFFFPVMIVLVYAGAEFTYQSFEMGERSGLSPWRPYLFPYKGLVFLSIFFLFLQGIAEFIRSAAFAIRGKAL
jgi:TRAP-type mannitol/chloroaromatic compound transport system permease small subunit